MCIRRTLNGGRLHGIASGLGIATGDVFYAAVVMLGLTAISGLIITHQLVFKFLACLVLIAAGILVAIARVPEQTNECRATTYLRDYLSMAGVTLSNPLTVIFFIAVVPAFGIDVPKPSFGSGALFVIGIFVGSVLWWIVLSLILGSRRFRSAPGRIQLVNRVSGILIAALGALSLIWFIMADG
jgi:threonine/homoserine/homoserine lactone efflux protein